MKPRIDISDLLDVTSLPEGRIRMNARRISFVDQAMLRESLRKGSEIKITAWQPAGSIEFTAIVDGFDMRSRTVDAGTLLQRSMSEFEITFQIVSMDCVVSSPLFEMVGPSAVGVRSPASGFASA